MSHGCDADGANADVTQPMAINVLPDNLANHKLIFGKLVAPPPPYVEDATNTLMGAWHAAINPETKLLNAFETPLCAARPATQRHASHALFLHRAVRSPLAGRGACSSRIGALATRHASEPPPPLTATKISHHPRMRNAGRVWRTCDARWRGRRRASQVRPRTGAPAVRGLRHADALVWALDSAG